MHFCLWPLLTECRFIYGPLHSAIMVIVSPYFALFICTQSNADQWTIMSLLLRRGEIKESVQQNHCALPDETVGVRNSAAPTDLRLVRLSHDSSCSRIWRVQPRAHSQGMMGLTDQCEFITDMARLKQHTHTHTHMPWAVCLWCSKVTHTHTQA